ncbi:UNVERIFIED_CONTAM: hypothetical protein Scaly_2636100 [Sesamum calycinum]|uniref:Integrase zinc-binding domain-containing protein n=1 Tax=Sesamum calycinum TaxID=2727403 RepID=A0AAW2JAT4_9LAMI
MPDVLADLATTLALSEGETTSIPVCNRSVLPSLDKCDHKNSNSITIPTNDEEDWRTPLIEYLKHGEEVLEAMIEAYSGICGARQSGPKLHFRIKRMFYYWLTMVKDCLKYVKKCYSCQLYTNFIHQPLEPLHPIVASWPFDAWGLDIVGPITPKSSAGHIYILATIRVNISEEMG